MSKKPVKERPPKEIYESYYWLIIAILKTDLWNSLRKKFPCFEQYFPNVLEMFPKAPEYVLILKKEAKEIYGTDSHSLFNSVFEKLATQGIRLLHREDRKDKPIVCLEDIIEVEKDLNFPPNEVKTLEELYQEGETIATLLKSPTKILKKPTEKEIEYLKKSLGVKEFTKEIYEEILKTYDGKIRNYFLHEHLENLKELSRAGKGEKVAETGEEGIVAKIKSHWLFKYILGGVAFFTLIIDFFTNIIGFVRFIISLFKSSG